jgi:hypothetical protein
VTSPFLRRVFWPSFFSLMITPLSMMNIWVWGWPRNKTIN